MSIFLVTWDQDSAKPNHAEARGAFLKQLAAYDHVRVEGFDAVCFVSTPSTASQVSAYLQQGLDPNDRLVVSNLGWRTPRLNPTVWAWISSRQ